MKNWNDELRKVELAASEHFGEPVKWQEPSGLAGGYFYADDQDQYTRRCHIVSDPFRSISLAIDCLGLSTSTPSKD